jgi:hypothetical protein
MPRYPVDPAEGPGWKGREEPQEQPRKDQSIHQCQHKRGTRRTVRVADKDKDRITLSFPPFSDLLIILIRPVQVHGEQSF